MFFTIFFLKTSDIDLMYKDTYFQKKQKKLFDTNSEYSGCFLRSKILIIVINS